MTTEQAQQQAKTPKDIARDIVRGWCQKEYWYADPMPALQRYIEDAIASERAAALVAAAGKGEKPKPKIYADGPGCYVGGAYIPAPTAEHAREVEAWLRKFVDSERAAVIEEAVKAVSRVFADNLVRINRSDAIAAIRAMATAGEGK